MFTKEFPSITEGIQELKRLSYSVAQAMGDEDGQRVQTPQEVITALANNVLFPQTGNGLGWDLPRLVATCERVEYTTTGGLTFGWIANFNSLYPSSSCLAGWFFFIRHPQGKAPKGSTLRASALNLNWDEINEGSDLWHILFAERT